MRLAGLVLTFCATPLLAGIQVTPSVVSFNPTLHATVTYAIKVTEQGTLTVRVLDRDTYVTRTLATNQPVTTGAVSLAWDGRDEHGEVVADEAWSLRVDFTGKHGTTTYFPAATSAAMASITPDFYDRQNGVLRYTLPSASRVHLQAGIADRSTTDKRAGAVMKTIVNRSPRPSGAVIEQWTGMDESGTIYVPALKNFIVGIAATPLPENAVITYGNRNRDFLTTALNRQGAPVLQHHPGHEHHQGLTALDDAAPRLTISTPTRWNATDKAWTTSSKQLRFTVDLAGPTVEQFRKQPGRLTVYLDERKVIDRAAGSNEPLMVDVPSGPEHIVAVNWSSDYGPVAATTFRVHRATQ